MLNHVQFNIHSGPNHKAIMLNLTNIEMKITGNHAKINIKSGENHRETMLNSSYIQVKITGRPC